MQLEQFVYKNQKKLRVGYTTGSCAAAAAGAAARLLLCGELPQPYCLKLPGGNLLRLPVEDTSHAGDWAACAVRKNAGDDPDVTDGLLIYARVYKTMHGIEIDGGEGVGRVTREGLDQRPGQAAINSTPRRMIAHELRSACSAAGYTGGLTAIISVPEGARTAAKTFNPRLGIEGGISILGTSGLVDPMSEQALIDTIHTEIRQYAAAGGNYLLLTPGNYGETFLLEKFQIPSSNVVKCSNYIGEALDFSTEFSFDGVLLVGHIGKMVKLAGGIMNTHSRCADARMEIAAAHAGANGAPPELIRRIMDCVTMDEALALLEKAGIFSEVMQSLMRKIAFHIDARVRGALATGAVVFSSARGELGRAGEAESLLSHIICESVQMDEKK